MKLIKILLFVTIALTAIMSFSVSAGTIETTVILPESYSRSVTGQFDTTQYPDQPLYSLTIERELDNSILVTIALVDVMLDQDPDNNPDEIVVINPDDVVDDPIVDPVDPPATDSDGDSDVVVDDPIVTCDPYEGTTKRRVSERLTTLAFIFDESTTKAQANQAIGRLFDDEADSRARVKALQILVHGCQQ